MFTIDLQRKLIATNSKIVSKDDAVLAKQIALDAESEKLVNAVLSKTDANYERSNSSTWDSPFSK